MASNPFKGIAGAPKRRERIALARRLRSDEQRRARMRELDDRTPLKPSSADLITGPAAQAALARIEREGRS